MTTLTISDTHFPYHHPDALDFIADKVREYKPRVVVHLGDEADCHRWSTHQHEVDALDSASEVNLVRGHIRELAKITPTLKLCTSNHVARLHNAASRGGIPSSLLRAWREVVDAPASWQWRDTWEIGGVTYLHGDGYSGPMARVYAAQDYGTPVVMGHLHGEAGAVWFARGELTSWGANAGCLIDPASPVMRYAKSFRKKPVLGTLVVVDNVPIFEPLR